MNNTVTTASATPIVNIAAYHFVSLTDTDTMRPVFKQKCAELGLRGTVILSPEGINLFLAASRESIDGFLAFLKADARLASVAVKESLSDYQPFNRMLVKLKPEIITMKMPVIRPEAGRAPAVSPKQLADWLSQGKDDAGREVVMMDTRNGFEVDVGTFKNALDYRITKFSDFPAVAEAELPKLQDKTVVTFCTGGIRCEKAAIYMEQLGYNVYQLDGGILKYFEDVGGQHYDGDCFVFDQRTALSPDLEPTKATQCFACRAVVTEEEQRLPSFKVAVSCPACYKPAD